jgi:two-component system OmpR family response regulator
MVGGALSFLIVDDEPLVQRALASLLRRYGACSAIPSASDAESQLEEGRLGHEWDGLLIDVRLQDGSGLDVLASARRKKIRAPALILSGRIDHDVVNRAAALDARLVSKPCGTSELAPFLGDVLFRKTRDRAFAAVERARHRWSLSDREVDILDHALRARSREQYLALRGMAQNTYKTHVRKLLEKSDYANLSTLAIDLLGED